MFVETLVHMHRWVSKYYHPVLLQQRSPTQTKKQLRTESKDNLSNNTGRDSTREEITPWVNPGPVKGRGWQSRSLNFLKIQQSAKFDWEKRQLISIDKNGTIVKQHDGKTSTRRG
jgi:hypothetical protein